MKYALFICVEEGVEPSGSGGGSIPDAVEAWATDLAERGVRLGGWPLAPTSDATTIRVRGGEVQRSDGSYADPMKRIAGFNILECASAEESLEVAQRHPVAKFGTVKIRPMVGG
jgi:hypothetical protein